MCLTLHSALSVKRSAKRSGSGSARSMISSSVMISLSWDCAPRRGHPLQAIRVQDISISERRPRHRRPRGYREQSQRVVPVLDEWECYRGYRATSWTLSMIFSSSQLAGNSVLPGLPIRAGARRRVRSPSSMCVARSGLTRISSAGGRSARLHLIPAAPIRSRVARVRSLSGAPPGARQMPRHRRLAAPRSPPHQSAIPPLELLLKPTRVVLPEHRRRFPQVQRPARNRK